MNLIEIQDLKKTYVEKTGVKTEALRGVSLSIEERAFIAIAGPSGSGKSTLLNLIGTLDTPDSGKILFEGKEITAIPPAFNALFRLHKIGFVFQSYNLFNQLTAQENVEYVMLLQGIPSKTRQERSRKLLNSVGLENTARKRPNQLSGGQQQRVAVLRAIAANPKIVLADEPTANLDSETASGLIDLMRSINQEYGITFIFSTHDKLVMNKADKIHLLKDGKIV